LCSKINLYLNSFDLEGNLIICEDGRSLLEKVEFHVSDLLEYFFKNKRKGLDVIIGCIPQVLAPEEAIDNAKISDNANDEFLHSLSNYTSEQGYVEDKFGLGLIARSVEESIDLLNSDGKLILNLGERPRREVLERLVRRRGMNINRIWKRKVAQANDTDIDSLVRLEKEMNHHFEFYTDLYSETPIDARTAKDFASKGGSIYHNLSVYECTFDYYSETKLLFDELKNDLFSEAKVGLDLDYNNGAKKEEKIRFLAELVKNLRQTNHFPYEDNQGEIEFRKSLAQFLSSYQHVNFTHDNVFIAPNLESLVENIIDLYQPTSIFLPENLFSIFKHLQKNDVSFSVPHCSKELNVLLEVIKPQIAVVKLNKDLDFTWEAFQTIIDITYQSGTRLFIDISDHFDLSSSPQTNGIFNFLSKKSLPIHVSLICELSKNQIYADLKTCFLISDNKSLVENLQNTAEFSYSRSPYLSQLFYTILLKELTSFHMKSQVNGELIHLLSEEDVEFKSKFIDISKQVESAFNHSSIKGNQYKIDNSTIRFDYGENELSSPDDLKISILESFTRQQYSDDEFGPKDQIQLFVRNRFSVHTLNHIYYGNGVAPLFASLVKIIKRENGTLFLPEGAYGYFYATANFYGVPIKSIPSNKEHDFIIQRKELELGLIGVENPWIFLNFPLINPTGMFWSDDQLLDLLTIPGIEKSTLIIDTVFSGLEFDGVKQSTVLSQFENKLKMVLLGGISKEYSAGGIRFGFALSNFDCSLNENLLFTPHKTVAYTVNKLYTKYNDADERINLALKNQIETLKNRSKLLCAVLQKNGWDVLVPNGGLFLVAAPKSLLGKTYKCSKTGTTLDITASNMTYILHDAINLLVNNDEWTGIKGYCRFVLSVEKSVFNEGLKRLENFHSKYL
jgi:methionine S-methyltransferase